MWFSRVVRKNYLGNVQLNSMQWVQFQLNTMIPQKKASRAYDANRDGFVIAGGGAVVVVEELEHALARGAKIYAES